MRHGLPEREMDRYPALGIFGACCLTPAANGADAAQAQDSLRCSTSQSVKRDETRSKSKQHRMVGLTRQSPHHVLSPFSPSFALAHTPLESRPGLGDPAGPHFRRAG